MPFAGIINKGENDTVVGYTQKNFEYCLGETVGPVAKLSVRPFANVIGGIASDIQNTGQSLLDVEIDLKRKNKQADKQTKSVTQEIKDSVNPFYVFMERFRAMGSQMSGVNTSIAYEVQGGLITITSMLLAMIKFVKKKVPFGKDILGCFAKGTYIRCADKQKPIENIVVGDTLWDGSVVTSTMILSSANVKFYHLDGVYVTDNHNVFHPVQGWIPAAKHPNAVQISAPYKHEHIYCFNTTSKTIKIGSTIFSDWDDIDGKDLVRLRRYFPEVRPSNIHKIFDIGYNSDTLLQLASGEQIQIELVQPGDILSHGEKIYGVVRLGDCDGTPRYHLLTENGSFHIYQNKLVGDYNTLIEKYL
jgi:hypothetical protein